MSELALAASTATMDLSAAELHGTVCGMLCALSRRQLAGLEDQTAADGGPDDDADQAAYGADTSAHALPLDDYLSLVGTEAIQDTEALLGFAHLARTALYSDDMSFAPLLPDDDEPVADRVEALAEWCSAFLAGIASLGDLRLSEEESDVLEDLSAIASAEVGTENEEEAERLYTEVVEYIRVSVLLLLQPDAEDEG